MPKKHKITKSKNIESSVMAKITSNEVAMKPKWYFVVGTVLGLTGLISTTIVAVFLTNLTMFLLKQHGPNGPWRLQQIIDSFPLWIPILAFAGVIGGIVMLKKYDLGFVTWKKINLFGSSNFAILFLNY